LTANQVLMYSAMTKCWPKYVLPNVTLYCTAGTISVTKKEDLNGCCSMCYKAEGIASIVSLNYENKKYQLMYDSVLDNGFMVYK